MGQQDGWNVVSTAPAPKAPQPSAGDGWNVVSTAPAPIRPAGLPDGVSLPGIPAAPQPAMQERDPGLLATMKDNFNAGTQHVPTTGPASLLQNFGAGGGDMVRFAHRAVTNLPSVIPSLLPPVQPTIQELHDASTGDPQKDIDNVFGDVPAKFASAAGQTGTGLILGEAGAMAAGKAITSAKMLPSYVRSGLAGDVTAPIVGSNITPLERYQSAKALGVNLDAADATNSGPLKMVKKVNENSLFGSGQYDNARARNISALRTSTDNFLEGMYPGDMQEGGTAIRDALRRNQQDLRNGAESGFQQLTEQTQGQPMQGSPAVGQKAQSLLSAIEPLAQKYPSLAPSKTMNVLSDLSNVGAQPQAPVRLSPFVDEYGKPMASAIQPPPARLDTFADLQKLRSATHDLTTTNPDLVKSQAIAPLQQMTQSLDGAMTNAANGLTPQQTSLFRDANANWSDMKDTYDNPSSPLYSAVRNATPDSLYSGQGLGPRNATAMQNLRPRLADAINPLQRGTVESALPMDSGGERNFKTFGTRLNRIPAEYRAELFSPEQNRTLKDMQNTSNVVNFDQNPSGSAKGLQKYGELTSLITPAAPLTLAQYPVARMMNSPKVVDWLMRPPTTSAPTAPVNSLFFAPKRKP